MLREPFPALGSILLKMIKIIVFTFKGQLSGKLQGELIAFSSLIVSVLPGGQVIVFICNILIGRKSYLISPRRTPDTTLIQSALSQKIRGCSLVHQPALGESAATGALKMTPNVYWELSGYKISLQDVV